MSTTTSNLGLIKPELTDHIHQSIGSLAANFQKLDDASDIYVNEIPASGTWNKKQRVYYNDVNTGGYIGAVNIRTGQAAPKWQSIHAYNIGDKVLATTNNGHCYECIQSGYSAPYEPAWLVAALTTTEDTRNKTVWAPSTFYELNEIVVPSVPNDRFYVCTVSGTSGTEEPAWSTANGVATSDNGAVWMTYRIVKWRECGVSANFRPFGKIE